jgi:hypothetical protein
MIETILSAAVEVATDDRREWAVNRPSRSVSVVRNASTVPTTFRAFAACVLDRESGGTLDRPQSGAGALNTAGSSAAGRWQYLRAWRTGLPYMVRDQLRDHGATRKQAKAVRVLLSGLPINQWPGVYQDMGFIETVERGGWFHWRNGDRCDRLAPR